MQAVAGTADGERVARLYSRTGEDISGAFPDLIDALDFDGAIDGELLILREGRVQSFNVLQQRLNRKTVNAKLLAEFPAHLRAYDLLVEGGEDLRELPVRRAPRAARSADRQARPSRASTSRRWCRSPTGTSYGRARRSGRRRRRADAEAVEGVMLKRRDAPYLPGRPEGPVVEVEARSARDRRRADVRAARPRQALVVLFRLYVRRVDRGRGGDELVPVGKAYFGFTDEELTADRPLRAAQHRQPLRPGARGRRTRPTRGWCSRSRSRGCSARPATSPASRCAFPRISRLRWDKPPREADRLETLEKMLAMQRARRGHDRSMIVSAMAPRRPREFAMSEAVVSRFLGGPPLAVLFRLVLLCVLVGVILSALGLRSRQHHRQHPPHVRRRSGTWASTRCAGCGAISCSAPSWSIPIWLIVRFVRAQALSISKIA